MTDILRFASLGSGSKGNATLINTGKTTVMVDCGFSVVEVERRMQRLGHAPESISALLLTHEHNDHIQGAARFSRRYKVPVWITNGTYNACRDNNFFEVNLIHAGTAFTLDDLQVQAYPVPHDAREPCQFVFHAAARRLGLLTDVGCITPHIVETLSGCHALMLECNYDPQQLHNGPYPASLKRRIDSRLGHLSNQQAAELLERMDTSSLQRIIGMHLSQENNHPEAALTALHPVLDQAQTSISIACQENGFDWEVVD